MQTVSIAVCFSAIKQQHLSLNFVDNASIYLPIVHEKCIAVIILLQICNYSAESIRSNNIGQSKNRFMPYGGAQFAKFLLAGGTGTALHYLIFAALVSMLGITPGPAAFVGAAAGACIVYSLNRRFTFASSPPHLTALPRFIALAFIGALSNGIAVGMLSSLGINFLLSQFMVSIIILIINFIVSKIWIFR
ncbi:GtrA family protein [Massilia sp. 9I]|uniref:GtrA family protein n=1 Tax=Massilia sp. 9I TaxID=2653152 RepID=UPI0012F215B4|nr:GtrA family protein [Massilia sp. 9I]VXC21982.1 membrane hypothetical protein [Massilia sp. 9I]